MVALGDWVSVIIEISCTDGYMDTEGETYACCFVYPHLGNGSVRIIEEIITVF